MNDKSNPSINPSKENKMTEQNNSITSRRRFNPENCTIRGVASDVLTSIGATAKNTALIQSTATTADPNRTNFPDLRHRSFNPNDSNIRRTTSDITR